ncbi:unnamed protein product [Paramecium sonneborni]|uniref:Uncharacterized protein n=1 Tax=Paramecium sonneborni TaxID=65129 RepID=A0A8S1PQV9_9CILI|nr:unnamed protein product [Paramecium sonneborni]
MLIITKGFVNLTKLLEILLYNQKLKFIHLIFMYPLFHISYPHISSPIPIRKTIQIILIYTKKHKNNPNNNGIFNELVFSNKQGDKNELRAAANSGTVNINPIAVPISFGIRYATILNTAICKISLAIPNIALPQSIMQQL